MIVAFIVSIEGCPYAFATGACPTSLSYSSEDWSTAWTVLDGALDWTDPPKWSERMRSDGTLETGGVSFFLHDVVPSSGPAAGYNVCTYMFTRTLDLVASTRLTVNATTSGTLTVESAAALGLSWPNTIWIERECIRVQSEAANVLTVAAGGRGYFGTWAQSHVLDDETLYKPEVWAAFPTAARRKVILWQVDDAGVVTPVWRGACGMRSPRLAGDRARFELACESIWTMHANVALGEGYAATKLRGFNASAINAAYRVDGAAPVGGSVWLPHGRPTFGTLVEACNDAAHLISLASTNPRIQPEGNGVVFRLDVTSGVSNASLTLRVGELVASSSSAESSGTRRAEVRVEPAPEVLVYVNTASDGNYIPVLSVNRLPTSWSAVPGTTYAGARTTVTPALRGAYDDDYDLDAYVVALGSSGTTGGVAAPFIQGTLRMVPKGAAAPPAPRGLTGQVALYINRAVTLKLASRVTTDHWAAGLANALADRATLRSAVDVRDWDFSTALMARVVAATGGPFARREWVFSGGDVLGELLKEELTLNGCGLALRGSRLAIVPLGPSAAQASAAATLTETDLVDDPAYEQSTEDQVTAVEATIAGATVRATDVRAVGRYGAGRVVKVKLRGRAVETLALGDPAGFARTLMGRAIGPFSQPVGLVTFPVAAPQYLSTVYLGDYVDVTEWVAPDSTGGRGIGNATAAATFSELSTRAQVLGREVDLASGTLRLECMLFGVVYGYAPACKVATSPSTTTVTVAKDFVNGVGDYTNPAASATDGGASNFPAGSSVKFVAMDSATLTEYGPYTVQGVSGTTITFTGAIDATLRTAIAGGDWYDLVSDSFAGGAVTALQKRYAYVGSDTAGVIDSTAVANRPWAP